MDPRRPEALAASGQAPSARRVLRGLVAAGVALGALAAVAGGWLLLVWLTAPKTFLAALAAGLSAPLAVWLLVAGWARTGAARAAQAAGALVTVAFYGWLGVRFAARGFDVLASRATLGVPPGEVAGQFGMAACAALMVAAVVAAIPAGRLGLPAAAAAAAIGAAAVAAGGASVAVAVDGDRCGTFRFESERWRAALQVRDRRGQLSDAERMAEAIVRCRTFAGATRAQVRRELGPAHVERRRVWSYAVGWTRDAMGMGDAQELFVRFGPDGRVRRTTLLVG